MNDLIQVRKSRELGAILGDSFNFLKENLKPIFIPIFIIAILHATIYALLIYKGFIVVSSSNALLRSGGFGSLFLSQFIVIVTSGIAYLSIYIILFRLIEFKSENPGINPTTNDLFKGFTSHFFRLFLIGIPSIIILFFLFLLLIIPGIWFYVIYLFLFPVAFFEKGSFGQILSRTRSLVKDNWWNSFLSFFIPQIILAIIGAIFAGIIIAASAYTVIQDNSNIASTMTIGLPIGYFFLILGLSFLNLWPLTCIVLQYFNLVERKDHLGLFKNLDTLGTEGPKLEVGGPQEY